MKLDRRTFLTGAAASTLASFRAAGLGRPALAQRRGAQAPERSPDSWRNWSRSVSWQPKNVERPASVEDVVGVVRAAAQAGHGVRVAGTGHSFVPLCATEGSTVLLTNLAEIESIDAESARAVVGAGAKLHQLHEPLFEAGLAFDNLPDIDRQALAGALATATHGTGPTFGSMSTQMVGARLVVGEGEVIECSQEQDPEILKAAQVSLGALGVITHIEVQLVEAFRLHERSWIAPFEEAVEQLPEQIEAHRHFEFFWVSDRDACLLKSLDLTQDPEDFERFEDDAGLVGERVGASGKIFPSLRNTRFNEIEYAVPAERGVDCWRELRELMLGKHSAITWPLEFRTVAADDAFLSPMYGRDTVTLSLHQAAELEYQPFFDDVEAICRNHQGRPHWGKIHTLEAAQLAELYPEWETFLGVRETLDPKGHFLNDYLRKLLLA